MINSNSKKERLDLVLLEKGFFESREKAKIAIMEGLIYVNNQNFFELRNVLNFYYSL